VSGGNELLLVSPSFAAVFLIVHPNSLMPMFTLVRRVNENAPARLRSGAAGQAQNTAVPAGIASICNDA
jgi:hypothetical protein